MSKFTAIAIDGPSGSGKSTLAKLIAEKLGYVYVDTGALYRSVGLYVRNKGIAMNDADAIVRCLPEIDISMKLIDGVGAVFLNGERVGDEIRTEEISKYSSSVSKLPEVRAFLLHLQKDIAKENNVIMDGRDIGTVVLPDADKKIFLVATPEARADRRYREVSKRGGKESYEQILEEILWRDKNDRERGISPAIPANDAVFIDSSVLSVEEMEEAALKIISSK